MTAQAWAAGQRVSPKHPCPVCGKPDWCGFSSDGRFVFCQRAEQWGSEQAIRRTDAGAMFAIDPKIQRPPLAIESRAVAATVEPLTRDLLDRVYRSLAERCGLDEHAYHDLVTRRRFPGALNGDAVYFSLPHSGTANEQVSEALIAEFGLDVIRGVPGFTSFCKGCEGRGSIDGEACRDCGRTGRLRPRFRSVRGGRHDYTVIACDADGLASWGQSRALPDRGGSKYILLSSSRAGDASLAGLPKYHVAGRRYPRNGEVWMTEGVVKAEVASDLLQRRVIGLVGVSIDRATLAAAQHLVDEWQCPRVVIAFDADKDERAADGTLRKPGVRQGEQKLIDALLPLTDVCSAEWNIAGGKGIDDLLVAGGSYRLVDRYTKPTPRPRVPRPCPEPGPVDGGDDLAAVQRKTAELITSRYGPGYRDTVTLVAPPPGTAKTGAGLRGEETTRKLAAWGVARHGQADELVARAGSEYCACGIARGDCATHRFVLNHDFGRNRDNCENFDVVETARDVGYGAQVGLWICGTQKEPRCPFFLTCEYQAAFARTGSHAAPVEMVTGRPTFTEQMGTVIFDDLDSGRLVQKIQVTAAMVERADKQRGARAIRPLLPVLARAIGEARGVGHYHRDAYAALDDAACANGTTLEALLAEVPPASAFAPEPSVAGFQAAVPGQLIDLVRMLHEEFPLYRSGGEFTSGIRITAEGIDIARLSTPVVTEEGTTSLTGKAVIVLSSTPDPVLRQWIGNLGCEVLAAYHPSVALPQQVRVIQDVGAFYGKASTVAHDPATLIRRAKAALSDLRPERPAAITHKHLRDFVAAELGIPLERVLYFGDLRGANGVRDADALLVLGTPGMRDDDAYWTACAAYRGPGAPPSRRMLMVPRRYGGWRDELGRGREIDVLTFADERVAEIFEAARRDELLQAIYRCRPLDRTGTDDRPTVTVVLLTAMPIDGLRIDELRFGGNAARAEELFGRLEGAVHKLKRQGRPIHSRAVAQQAGTSVGNAQAYARRVSATRSPTCINTPIQVGDQTAETLAEATAEQGATSPGATSQPHPERKYLVGQHYLVRDVPFGPLQTPPGLAEWREQAGYPYAGIVTIEGETILIDDVRAALRSGRFKVLGVAPTEATRGGVG